MNFFDIVAVWLHLNPPENSHHLEVNCNNPLFCSMRTLHLRFHSQKSPKRKNRANPLFRACVDPHSIKRVPKRELAEFLCLGLFFGRNQGTMAHFEQKTALLQFTSRLALMLAEFRWINIYICKKGPFRPPPPPPKGE